MKNVLFIGFFLGIIPFLSGCSKSQKPAPVIFKSDSVKSATNLYEKEKNLGDAILEDEVDVSDSILGAQQPLYHTVIPGETVLTIATHYKIDLGELVQKNNIIPPYQLTPGQRLIIPRKGGDFLPLENVQVVEISSINPGNMGLEGGVVGAGTQNVAPNSGSMTPAPAPADPWINSLQGPQASMDSQTPALVKDLRTHSGGNIAPTPSPNDKKELGHPTTALLKSNPLLKKNIKAEAIQQDADEDSVVASYGEKPFIEKKNVIEKKAPSPLSPPKEKGLGVPKEPRSPVIGAPNFVMPVMGEVVMGFGIQQGDIQNDGINIAAPKGAPVRATAAGEVAYTGNEARGFGNLILIKHADKWISAYAHLDKISIKRGDTVQQGQVIGTIGTSGKISTPQLHFELRRDGISLDPQKYL